MITKIPEEIINIYHKIQSSGFEVYFVGGCVRNLLMKIKVKDWDLTTKATPQEILNLFPDGFYDNQFGTVGIPVKISTGGEFAPHNKVVEITTFRTERDYQDRRHPKIIEWGKSLEEDLARRDFTINAIALELVNYKKNQPLAFKIIDFYEGQKDIKSKIIRAVGDPKKRFKEDALRLLRAVRLATELAFTIEEKTWTEMVNDASLIKEISAERVRDEFLRILASDYAYDGIMLLKNSGVLDFILPELSKGIGISQERPGRHHKSDVFTHNVLSLKFCPSKDPIVRFAALIHDFGKAVVAAKDEQGFVIFHNHEIVSSKMAREICDRLKFSKKDRDKVVNLVRWHMFTIDEHITDAAIRRFIRRVGVENVKDMIDLRIGDRLGGGTQTAESWRLKKFKARVEEQLQPLPFSINDLAIDGNDVMKELNIKPSPKVGKILQKLFEEVDEDLTKNNKEYLLKRAQDINKTSN